MFTTAQESTTRLENALKLPEGTLPSYWSGHITSARTFAYQEILGRLVNRGFTKTQIDSWDRGAEFEGDLFLWRVLHLGGVYDSFDPKTLESLDRREELDEAMVFASGVWLKATGDNPGLITSGGTLSEGTNSIFSWPDPNDQNLGQVTRW